MKDPPPHSPKFKGWHFQLLFWSLLILWSTGIGWLWLHHFQRIDGQFGPEPHPFEPWMLRLHGFFMLPALLAIGGLIVSHIGIGWRYEHKRATGLAQCVLYLALILTGYALYYSGDDGARGAASVAHWALGAAAPFLFIWHLSARRKPK